MAAGCTDFRLWYHEPLANPVLFADDTSMIVKSNEPCEFIHTLQRNVIKADRWFKSKSLLLNMDKTHLLQFNTKNWSNNGPRGLP